MPRQKKLRISNDARDEIFRIWAYLLERSGDRETADRLIDAIAERYAMLQQFPSMGRRRDELGPGVRSLPVGSYIIYYRVEGDYIEISHIAHGSRLPENVFEEE